jgi:chemotaxis protein methyltransferase CheR
MIKLSDAERESLSQYIYSLTAISLDQSKAYLIESRLNDVAAQAGCASFTDLLYRARTDSSGAISRRITDAITTNETLFFRDQAPFDLLRHKLIPELVDRKSKSPVKTPIRIWSAASSTGQEIYSIGIVLKELLGDPLRYGVRLLGTDISDQAVARASKGVYTEVEMSRGLNDAMKAKYFRLAPGGWQIADEIRAMASFKRLNLVQDFASLGRFDVIFCRNVAIYFNERDRAGLFNRLEKALEREGALVIGSMESLSGICPQFESKRHLRTVYYQVRGQGGLAQSQFGRAS